jgi:hypothetical protein
MSQIARNLTDAEQEILTGKRYLIHDRDPLFTAEFLNTIAEAGVGVGEFTMSRLTFDSPAVAGERRRLGHQTRDCRVSVQHIEIGRPESASTALQAGRQEPGTITHKSLHSGPTTFRD